MNQRAKRNILGTAALVLLLAAILAACGQAADSPTVVSTAAAPTATTEPTVEPSATSSPSVTATPEWQSVAGVYVSFQLPPDWQPGSEPVGMGSALEAWTLGIPGVESDQSLSFFELPFDQLEPPDLVTESAITIGGKPGAKWLRSGEGYISYDYYTTGPGDAGSFGIHVTVPAEDPELEAVLDLVAASVAFSDALPTATATSTSAPPTVTPTSQPTLVPTPVACTDAATFIADVTVPDDSQVTANAGFVKTWRIRNSGTCTWDNRYSLVNTGGTLLGASSPSFPLPGTVAPGQTVDLSVSLVAPALDGYYLGEWKLSNPQGTQFGVGASNSPMWVRFWVGPVESGGSIAGFLWADHCFARTEADGNLVVDGHCVVDANGEYRADGMLSPDEGYLGGVTMLLQAGPCATDNPAIQARAVTNQDGYYAFTGLQPGTYCVLMNAAADGNAAVLLPGDWTFPDQGIWYQQITLIGNDQAYPVNFGWDFQLK